MRKRTGIGTIVGGAVCAVVCSMLGFGQTTPSANPAAATQPLIETLAVGIARPMEYSERERLSNFRGYAVRRGTLAIFQTTCPEGDILKVTDFTLLRVVDDQGDDLTATPPVDSRPPFNKPYAIAPDSKSIMGYVACGGTPSPGATRITVTASITAQIGVGAHPGAPATITMEPGQSIPVPGGTLTVGIDGRSSLIHFIPTHDAAPVQTLLFAREDGAAVPANVSRTHDADTYALTTQVLPNIKKVVVTPVLYDRVKTVHVPMQMTLDLGSTAAAPTRGSGS